MTLSAPKKCLDCDTPLSAGASFCGHCGAACTASPCGRCFEPLQQGDHYCVRCGLHATAGQGRLVARTEWSDERKIATILFADLAGFTALSSSLEPDQVWELANTCMAPLAREVESRGGTVVKYIGDAIMAVFGVPKAEQGDATRAVEAGLAMVERMKEISPLMVERFGGEVSIRVGINTGLVMVGAVGEGADRRPDVLGTAVNLASRIEGQAPHGGVMVGPSTWRQAMVHFVGETQAPVRLKGIPEPVALTHVSRPRTEVEVRSAAQWQLTAPGVRELELETMQTAFELVEHRKRLRILRLVGDPGLGKELLLRRLWKTLSEDARSPLLLESTGRRWLQDAASPLIVLGGLLRSWYPIAPTADPKEARRHFIHRVDELLRAFEETPPLGTVDLLANLAGLHDREDRFEAQEGYSNLEEVVEACALWLRALCRGRTVVLLISELHRADEASLNLLPRLFSRLKDEALLGVLSSELVLDERRPRYLEDSGQTERLDILALDEASLQQMVRDLLTGVDGVPAEIPKAIATRAEGNPGFARELIRMLHDTGAIERTSERDEAGKEQLQACWRPDRCDLSALPETVQGVLQARLDSFPLEEKEVLKRASVVGRSFWGSALEFVLPETMEGHIADTLQELQRRRVIDRRRDSALPGDLEFVFKSTALRDTALNSLPAGARKATHLAVARWLQAQGALWEDGHLLLAHHLIEGGRPQDARWPLVYAARRAAAIYAHESAADLYGKALFHWPEEGLEAIQRVSVMREQALEYDRMGEATEARNRLETVRDFAETLPRDESAESLAWIDFERCLLFKDAGRSQDALEVVNQSLNILETIDLPQLRVRALAERGFLLANQGHEEGFADIEAAKAMLPLGRSAKDPGWLLAEGHLSNAEGSLLLFQEKWGQAREAFLHALECSSSLGLTRISLLGQINLGAIAFVQNDFHEAARSFEGALISARRANDQSAIAVALSNLGQAFYHLGDLERAREKLEAAVKLGGETGRREIVADGGPALADILCEQGEIHQAERLAREAVEASVEIGQPMYILTARSSLVGILQRRWALDQAASSLTEARAELQQLFEEQERSGLGGKKRKRELTERFSALLVSKVTDPLQP